MAGDRVTQVGLIQFASQFFWLRLVAGGFWLRAGDIHASEPVSRDRAFAPICVPGRQTPGRLVPDDAAVDAGRPLRRARKRWSCRFG